jgi:hypothetical protein
MGLMLDTMVPAIVQGIKQQAPQISEETVALLSTMLLEEMKKNLPGMLAIQARVYANHFTMDELNNIKAFYESPVGQKTITEAPKIMQETIPLGMAWGKQSAEAAIPRVLEKLRAQGVKI